MRIRAATCVTGAMIAGMACGGQSRDDGAFGSGAPTQGATSGADADGGTNGQETGSQSVEDDGADDQGDGLPVLDVGHADDGIGPSEGCEKIDFLFVVDNSGSMGAHQTALVNSFGPFMDTIFATVQAQDYHIMVVDSDAAGDIDGACEPCTPDSFWCDDWCDVKGGLDLACERTLGAGEVAPYNHEASNKVCGVPDGLRYLTSESTQETIKSTFQCLGKVGVFGSGAELPMSALVEALATQSAPGGCNAGFLRDDAILVVTVISDDYPVPGTSDDASDVGMPSQWRDAVVQAKGGVAENIVMLGIINTAEAACVSGAGDPIVHPTERFVEFVESFDARGLTGNICSENYSTFFEEAVGLIDTACDEFVPEG